MMDLMGRGGMEQGLGGDKGEAVDRRAQAAFRGFPSSRRFEYNWKSFASLHGVGKRARLSSSEIRDACEI